MEVVARPGVAMVLSNSLKKQYVLCRNRHAGNVGKIGATYIDSTCTGKSLVVNARLANKKLDVIGRQ
jgi:hypothetical protein